LITLKQIELDHGVSRSALHTYRRSSTFPQPVAVEGSTKTLYRADEVAAWFHANPKQQGKKRDQFVSQQQGETAMKVYTVTLRVETDSDVTPDQIRQEIYDACPDVPFGFEITSVEQEG
jgi:predicted DNA-binding transcriptional regulator AlpA